MSHWYVEPQPQGKDGDMVMCKVCEWKPFTDKKTREVKFTKSAPWLRIHLRHVTATAEHDYFRLTCTAERDKDTGEVIRWKYNIKCPNRLINVSTIKTVVDMQLRPGVAYGKGAESLGCTTRAGMIRHLDESHKGTSAYIMQLFDAGIAELEGKMREESEAVLAKAA